MESTRAWLKRAYLSILKIVVFPVGWTAVHSGSNPVVGQIFLYILLDIKYRFLYFYCLLFIAYFCHKVVSLDVLCRVDVKLNATYICGSLQRWSG